MLATPLLREDTPLGAILIARGRNPIPFRRRQIALLETFANQAVIAIENVRLFKELEARNRDLTEALEQQTATSEILRVISASPTELQPVLDAVAQSSARLCGAMTPRSTASMGMSCVWSRDLAPSRSVPPRRLCRSPGAASSARGHGSTDHSHPRHFGAGVRDHFAEAWAGCRPVRASFWDSHGAGHADAPGGVAVGVILIRRLAVQPFSDKQIELLKTFADQAVIAIENVRLFKELEVARTAS